MSLQRSSSQSDQNTIRATCSKPLHYVSTSSIVILAQADEVEQPLSGEGVKYTFEVLIQPLRPHEAAEFVAFIKPIDAIEYESAVDSLGDSVEEIFVTDNGVSDDLSFYTPSESEEVMYMRSGSSSEGSDGSEEEFHHVAEAQTANDHVGPTDEGFDADSESESPRVAKTARKKRASKVLMTC